MSREAKNRLKVQKRLGQLRRENGHACWVCGSPSGVKTAREGYGTRCKRCIDDGKTNAAVDEYDRLKSKL